MVPRNSAAQTGTTTTTLWFTMNRRCTGRSDGEEGRGGNCCTLALLFNRTTEILRAYQVNTSYIIIIYLVYIYIYIYTWSMVQMFKKSVALVDIAAAYGCAHQVYKDRSLRGKRAVEGGWLNQYWDLPTVDETIIVCKLPYTGLILLQIHINTWYETAVTRPRISEMVDDARKRLINLLSEKCPKRWVRVIRLVFSRSSTIADFFDRVTYFLSIISAKRSQIEIKRLILKYYY